MAHSPATGVFCKCDLTFEKYIATVLLHETENVIGVSWKSGIDHISNWIDHKGKLFSLMQINQDVTSLIHFYCW